MKKHLTISIDEAKFNELSNAAKAMGMKRTTYVETLIDRARNTDIPSEILMINEYFNVSKGCNLAPEVKAELDKPIKELVKLLSEGGKKNGKIQSNKKDK